MILYYVRRHLHIYIQKSHHIMAYHSLQKLTLSDGRILAYDENGNTSSNVLLIFFHGVFGVGSAPRLQKSLVDYNVHYIVPTLPGWGESSPTPKGTTFVANLLSSMTQLINHVKPNHGDDLRIYVAGGSYGTAPAQILYGASTEVFPLGRYIRGCLLLAPFSPFKYHKDYAKSMTMPNYLSVGPPSQWFPFLPRIIGSGIKSKLSTQEKMEEFLNEFMFAHASKEEQAKFDAWCKSECMDREQFIKEMACNGIASMANGMLGFNEVAPTLHSDWGFDPSALDKERYKDRPLHIVASTNDDLGPDMANWLEKTYPNTKLEFVEGGHVVSITELDRLWRQLLGD